MRKRSWKQFYALEPNPIGHGGQAEVLRALDRQIGATVALKRLVTISADGIAQMRREVEVQQRLSHPRIMRLQCVEINIQNIGPDKTLLAYS